jgi:hypothetical protein
VFVSKNTYAILKRWKTFHRLQYISSLRISLRYGKMFSHNENLLWFGLLTYFTLHVCARYPLSRWKIVLYLSWSIKYSKNKQTIEFGEEKFPFNAGKWKLIHILFTKSLFPLTWKRFFCVLHNNNPLSD